MEWEGGPKRGAFDETSWACALVLKSPTEKRKFLVGVPGQCGARKGGSRGGGVGPGGLGAPGVEQEGGEPGRGAGVGAGGLGGVGGWSRAEVLVGELPKTETRKFLVGVPGQGGAGRDGSGGGGMGLGGGWVEWEGGPKHGPFGGTWWECCPKQKNGSFWLGSWTGWSRKGGERGGAGVGPGRLGGLGGGSQARSF